MAGVTHAAAAARMAAALTAAALLLAGCQLVDEGAPDAVIEESSAPAPPPIGSPDEEFPTTLSGLRAFLEPEALAWQDLPVLVDVTVWLDERSSWDRTRVTWIAGGADRMMTVRAAPNQLRVERPLLQGLQLLEVPPEAAAEIPPFPDGVLEPGEMAVAAQDALDRCDGGGPVRAVLYATGAPAAWDGQEWTLAPRWRAVVVSPRAAVTVDPVTATPLAPLTCAEPLLLDED